MIKNIFAKIADWLFNVAYVYGYVPECHEDIFDEVNNYHLEVNTRAMEASIKLRKLIASK